MDREKRHNLPTSIANRSVQAQKNASNRSQIQQRISGGSKKVVSLKNKVEKTSDINPGKARRLSNSNSTKVHLDNREEFLKQIETFRENNLTPNLDSDDVDRSLDDNIIVAVRKRPIFQFELDHQQFDCVSIQDPVCFLHNCQLDVSWTPTLVNRYYKFDYAFDESASNEEVYERTFKPQLNKIFDSGLSVIAYGQTSSGKTYTISAILTHVARDIFTIVDPTDIIKIGVIESFGNDLVDLSTGVSANIYDDPEGGLIYRGLNFNVVMNSSEFLEVINLSLEQRRSSSTNRNDRSSRSHAIFRIVIERNEVEVGSLTLADLAGSERSSDSLYHDKETARETALINSSLMVLKECIRTRAQNSSSVRVPYRQSKLTMLLKHCFVTPNHKTIFLGMISPIASDTNHTNGTLEFIKRLKVTETVARDRSLLIHWTKGQVQKFMKDFCENEDAPRFCDMGIDNILQCFRCDGRTLSHMTVDEFKTRLGNEFICKKLDDVIQQLKKRKPKRSSTPTLPNGCYNKSDSNEKPSSSKYKLSINLFSENFEGIGLDGVQMSKMENPFEKEAFKSTMTPVELFQQGKKEINYFFNQTQLLEDFAFNDNIPTIMNGIYNGRHVIVFRCEKWELLINAIGNRPYLQKDFQMYTTLPVDMKNKKILIGANSEYIRHGLILLIQNS
eukprot:TRINITY_DN1738_c0_g2_i1.p1 TRINITY_DN1738_c0_g2~~TRINITY_DN1738_c0_g2_i1.p1  ORF type:complete len:684 (-),score=122.72 TRINITY_DN1738_c0_g2_i1:76-2094(-)